MIQTPTPTPTADVISLVERLITFSPAGLFVLALITGYYEVWMFGKIYRRDMAAWQKRYDEDMAASKNRLEEKSRECAEWKSAYLRSVAHTDRVLELASKPPSSDG